MIVPIVTIVEQDLLAKTVRADVLIVVNCNVVRIIFALIAVQICGNRIASGATISESVKGARGVMRNDGSN